MHRTLPLATATLLACGAAVAGTAQVSFIDPARYADAGTSSRDEQANLQALERHLQDLARRLLPPGHVLKVEVLDLDLAGTVRPVRTGEWLRIVSGSGDFPRMTLRYSLEAPGQAARSGEDRLADLGYPSGLRLPDRSAPLHDERQMLERWVRERFLVPRAD